MMSDELTNISELLAERVKGGHSMGPSELNALDRQIADLAARVRHIETTPIRIVTASVVHPEDNQAMVLSCDAFREQAFNSTRAAGGTRPDTPAAANEEGGAA